MREIIISENEKEQKLLKLLQKFFKGQKDSFLYKMLRKKNILLNGKKADGKERLHLGDKVQLYFSEESLEKLSSVKAEENGLWQEQYKKYIVYEDAQLILFNKPAGLLAEEDAKTRFSVNTLLSSYLLQKGEQNVKTRETFRPGIANRLDRNTSGLIIFGKTLASLQSLGRLLQSHSLKKKYYALVSGTFDREGLQEAYIRKDEKRNKVTKANKETGKYLASVFSVDRRYRYQGAPFTLLTVDLLTGKTHQIRSQLSFLGYPILGDIKYAIPEINGTKQDICTFPDAEKAHRKLSVKRQLLHAYSLSFPSLPKEDALYPISGKTFQIPLAEDFEAVLKQMEPL